jgi:hypothetical protein
MSDRLQIRLPSTNIFFRSGLVLARYLSFVFEINGLVRLSLRKLNRHINVSPTPLKAFSVPIRH